MKVLCKNPKKSEVKFPSIDLLKSKNFWWYVDRWMSKDSQPFEDNYIFYARLKPISYSRGRSSVNFNFQDADDPEIRYVTAPQATFDLLSSLTQSDGVVKLEDNLICGNFTFVKQGTQYSIVPYAGSLI